MGGLVTGVILIVGWFAIVGAMKIMGIVPKEAEQ
jgi:hypothetical protein